MPKCVPLTMPACGRICLTLTVCFHCAAPGGSSTYSFDITAFRRDLQSMHSWNMGGLITSTLDTVMVLSSSFMTPSDRATNADYVAASGVLGVG